ncbi:hypothetical protein [Bradyrhizobium tunisiense]|uniref:hypothetical protein n=1 Tax=Bradyrhizobium tunisiense TaxID=3278709 RepID=UPI0035DB8A6A
MAVLQRLFVAGEAVIVRVEGEPSEEALGFFNVIGILPRHAKVQIDPSAFYGAKLQSARYWEKSDRIAEDGLCLSLR